jgi:hypothetical protein
MKARSLSPGLNGQLPMDDQPPERGGAAGDQ